LPNRALISLAAIRIQPLHFFLRGFQRIALGIIVVGQIRSDTQQEEQEEISH